MKLSWPVRLLLALGSGVGLGLAFPNPNLYLLAWIAIAMLMLASLGAGPMVAALCGFLQGIAFYPTCLPWIDTVMQQYGNVGPWDAAGILGLMGVAGGVLCAVFTMCVAALGKRNLAVACSLAPCLWVALEFVRTHLPYIGFPWNLTGYAVVSQLSLLQLAAWMGIYGLSFLVAAFNSLLVLALVGRARRARIALAVAIAVLVILGEFGSALVPHQSPRYLAHLVQTNFPQSEHYPPDWMTLHAGELDELERISVDAARHSPGLVVWPEVPAPFSSQDPKFRELAQRIARDSGGDFLFGVVDWKQDAQGNWLATNSAALLDPSGQRIFAYDKIHLVPFGEYVPLRRWIKFAGRLTADISDFTPGTAYRIGNIPGGRFGVFICYEAIFPAEVRQFTRVGAELLINISNDGWFGRSSAPAQHLRMARVRAVENRRWLLRGTNNGYTVSVDPYGRIVARLAPDVRGVLEAPYDFRSDLTPYARWGDWFAWLCVAGSVILYGFGISRRIV